MSELEVYNYRVAFFDFWADHLSGLTVEFLKAAAKKYGFHYSSNGEVVSFISNWMSSNIDPLTIENQFVKMEKLCKDAKYYFPEGKLSHIAGQTIKDPEIRQKALAMWQNTRA